MQDRTTVLVDAPFLGVCGAVHMQELMNALGQEDALGLRERLLIAYDHPRFVRSAQLQEACLRIPAATLHDYLAKRLWPLHVMHHPHHPPAERFASDLNYKWVQYTWHDGAAELFWENFDDRAAEQEAAYKIDQQAAKKAGKWKTRHFRLALPIHNLRQLAANASIETWDKKVSWEAAKASLLFSSWLDSVFAELDLHRKPAQPAPSPSPAPSAASVPPVTSARDELRRILAFDTVEGVLSQPNINIQHLRTMMLAVLVSSRRPILRNTDVSHLRPVLALNLNVAASHLLAARALKLLALLGCGAVSLSVNVGGSKVLWFTKIASDDWNNAVLDATRIALQVPEDGFSSWARARILESKQKGQAEIVFPDLNHAAVQASLTAAVAAWTQAMAAAA